MLQAGVLRRPPRAPQPAAARRRPGLRAAGAGEPGPAQRSHQGQPGHAPQALLAAGELVGVFPEGFKGIGKPFSERYQLQRFGRGGFVRTAISAGVPIVPCAIVGAEEIYPMIGNAARAARLLRLPYFPVTPLFPWLGPLGAVPLPSNWIIEFCDPVPTAAAGRAAAARPDDEARSTTLAGAGQRTPIQERLDALGGRARARRCGQLAGPRGAAERPAAAAPGPPRPPPTTAPAAATGSAIIVTRRPDRKSCTGQPRSRACAPQLGVRVHRVRVADEAEHRQVVGRVAVGAGPGQVQVLALGQRLGWRPPWPRRAAARRPAARCRRRPPTRRRCRAPRSGRAGGPGCWPAPPGWR